MSLWCWREAAHLLCVLERAALHCMLACLVKTELGGAAVKFSGGFFFLILFEPKHNMVFVFLKLELQWTINKVFNLGLKVQFRF